MNELFDDAESLEPAEPLARVRRSDSTPETLERWALLKTKRKGVTWEEDGRLYRQGATGVTVFNWRHDV